MNILVSNRLNDKGDTPQNFHCKKLKKLIKNVLLFNNNNNTLGIKFV